MAAARDSPSAAEPLRPIDRACSDATLRSLSRGTARSRSDAPAWPPPPPRRPPRPPPLPPAGISPTSRKARHRSRGPPTVAAASSSAACSATSAAAAAVSVSPCESATPALFASSAERRALSTSVRICGSSELSWGVRTSPPSCSCSSIGALLSSGLRRHTKHAAGGRSARSSEASGARPHRSATAEASSRAWAGWGWSSRPQRRSVAARHISRRRGMPRGAAASWCSGENGSPPPASSVIGGGAGGEASVASRRVRMPSKAAVAASLRSEVSARAAEMARAAASSPCALRAFASAPAARSSRTHGSLPACAARWRGASSPSVRAARRRTTRSSELPPVPDQRSKLASAI